MATEPNGEEDSSYEEKAQSVVVGDAFEGSQRDGSHGVSPSIDLFPVHALSQWKTDELARLSIRLCCAQCDDRALGVAF